MRISILMTALALPALAMAAQSDPSPDAEPICRDPKVHRADQSKAPLRAEPLDRQPLGNQEKAVMYREDGCLKPIMVRENVGTEQR